MKGISPCDNYRCQPGSVTVPGCDREFRFDSVRCLVRLSPCSGCEKPNEREKRTTLIFRFRSKKQRSNALSPRSWSFSPTGIVTTPAKACVGILPLNPGCMSFVRGTKLRQGTGSQRSRTSRAGLRQGVGARNKAMPAPGYSVASPLSRTSSKLVSVAHAGGYALLCTSSSIRQFTSL
jgi:hypothetical protein